MKDQQENKRAVTALDAHIGERIKAARSIAGISQNSLAETMDITFQQVQKYENGTNRIPASRLYNISLALNLDITHFYEGYEQKTELLKKNNTSHEELDNLSKAYAKIKDPNERGIILNLIRSYTKK